MFTLSLFIPEAVYYFLGQYEKAIEYYQHALDHGADAEMLADNIQEAREAIAKRKEIGSYPSRHE